MAKTNLQSKVKTAVEVIEDEIKAMMVHQDTALKALITKLEKAKEEEEKKNAVALIQAATNEAYAAIERAKALALKYDLSFEFSVEYGMGGSFNEYQYDGSRSGDWESSSSQC